MATVCSGQAKGQEAFFPLVPTLVQLLGRVPGACTALKSILRDNVNLCYQVTDHTLQAMVGVLRRNAPECILDAIMQVGVDRCHRLSRLVWISWGGCCMLLG